MKPTAKKIILIAICAVILVGAFLAGWYLSASLNGDAALLKWINGSGEIAEVAI